MTHLLLLNENLEKVKHADSCVFGGQYDICKLGMLCSVGMPSKAVYLRLLDNLNWLNGLLELNNVDTVYSHLNA